MDGNRERESGTPGPPRRGQRRRRGAVVTAGPKDPLASRGRPRPRGEGGGRGHSPRPLPYFPGPKPPGNQKTGLVTREQKLYRTDDTISDSCLLPRLSSFLVAAVRRPPSSTTSRNPILPASKMAPGYRLSSKTGAVKVPARRKRKDSGRCSFLYEAMRKMAAPVTGSRERGGAKPLGPTLSEERILESYGFLESIFDFLKFYLIFIILVFLKKFFHQIK